MKRIILSSVFLLAFAVAGKAQTPASTDKQKDTKSEAVNADGTLKQEDKATKPEDKGKTGTRMAITEKGIPANKSKNAGKSSVDPGQGKATKSEAPVSEKK
jgi:hypothetical protein